MKNKIGTTFLLVTGFLACPCTIPIILSILFAIFGGTAIAAWMSNNIGLIYTLGTGYFIFALIILALKTWRRTESTKRAVTGASQGQWQRKN